MKLRRRPARSNETQPKLLRSIAEPARHPLVFWLLANARWIWPLAVIAAVVTITWSDLRNIDYRQVRDALETADAFWLSIALLLTLVNLAVMGIYDVLCLRDTQVRTRERWWIGALAFAWGCFLTFGPVAGPAVRFWLYRPFGVSFDALRKAILAIAAGYVCGLILWVPFTLLPLPSDLTFFVVRSCMVFLAAILAGYLAARVQHWRRFPEWVRGMDVHWPALFMLGALDWLLAFLVFSACFRAAGMAVAPGLLSRLYFLGQGLGVLSLMPGGLGSADAFWLAASGTMVGRGAAGLLSFRVIYYLLPWTTASVLLLRRAVHGKVRWGGPARWCVATIVFLAGCLMLINSATPALIHRLQAAEKALPIFVLETSHLASAIFGLFLCVVARGLMKGYRYAYRTTLALLIGGAAGCMLKSLDYEEAIIFVLTAALLWTHAELFTLPSRPGGTTIAIVAPIALALFVFAAAGFASYGSQISKALSFISPNALAHVPEPVRFLRTLGVLLLLALLIAVYLIMRIPHRYVPPSREEIGRALAIHERVGKGTGALKAANADKSILFMEDWGFCLYRTIGRYMVVFADPSAESGMERKCLTLLLQKAAELDRTLAFYQISARWLPVLNEFGYSFFKLGEEALVDLNRFDLQGEKSGVLRAALNQFNNGNYTFEVLPAIKVSGRIAELKAVSDAWLHGKKLREKQFSVGFFNVECLTSSPCATLADQGGRLVAFASVLPHPNQGEFALDLLRYLPECPKGVPDLLVVNLIRWGKERGFQTLNLGMAPLSAPGETRDAHMGERMVNILYQHGEHPSNPQYIRLFKQKYDPRWAPRYIAYPGFWIWPQVIFNVAALMAGGWRNIIFPSEKEA